jgi:chaperone BCS1
MEDDEYPFATGCDCGEETCEYCNDDYREGLREGWKAAQKKYKEKKGPKFSAPSTIESWIVGVLGGGDAGWMKGYIESPFFKVAREELEKRTGLDINWLVSSYTLYGVGVKYAPTVLNGMRFQFMSSVTVNEKENIETVKAVQHFIANQAKSTSAPSIRLHGQHVEMDKEKNFASSALETKKQFFWHEERLFMLESSAKQDRESWEDVAKLVISCFGMTDAPIRALIEHCRNVYKGRSAQLVIKSVSAGGETSETVNKRPLDTIDMETKTMSMLKRSVEDFFDPNTRDFYQSAGHPYRMGLLLYGPPGTGKTSLATALASHVSVSLFLIKLGGMGDDDLEKAFHELPEHCVVLLEDIDTAGVYRDSLSQARQNTKLPAMRSSRVAKDMRTEDERNKHASSDGRDSGYTTEEGDKETENEQSESDESEDDKPKKPKRSSQSPRQFKKGEKKGDTQGKASKPERVSLSGLLNVIDGVGAKQGRLLIMTTNAPKSLDPALHRRGRIDKVIHMSYCTKETAELTFKRIFGKDRRRAHTQGAIDRYAAVFKAQFPQRTKLVPAGLAVYLLTHRGNPQSAIKEFPEFLRRRKTGEDEFAYDINEIVGEVDADLDQVEEIDSSALGETFDDLLPVVREVEEVSQDISISTLTARRSGVTLTAIPLRPANSERTIGFPLHLGH